jgi:hypothetical protein
VDKVATESAVALDDYAPCGVVSLYLACRIRAVPVTWEQLQSLVGPPGPDGSHSFEDLSRAAMQLGLHPIGLHTGREALNDLPMPAVIQVINPHRPDLPPHLLVLLRTEVDGVFLLDAPFPANFTPNSQFQEYWTGNVLVLALDEQQAQRVRSIALAQRGLSVAFWGWGALGGVSLLVLVRPWRWRGKSASGSTNAHLGFGRAILRAPARFPKSSAGLLTAILLTAILSKLLWKAKPSCVLEKPVVDLGIVAPGEHTIPVALRNAGDQPLRISAVNSNCTCGVIVKHPDVIEARQRGTVEVLLQTSSGSRSIRLQVLSNDPAGPKNVVLTWHGEVTPLLIPSFIHSSPVPCDLAYERTIQVVYPGGKSAPIPRLERFECNSPLMSVREGRNDPLAKKFGRSGLVTNILGELDLQLRVQAPPQPGWLRAQCKFFLKYGKSTVPLTLPIAIPFTAGPLAPDVDAITFSSGRLEELKGQERLVRVTDRAPGGEIIIQDVPDWLEAKVLSRSANESLLRLRLLKSPPGLFVSRSVTIARARDARSKVVLPVRVFAAQSRS